MAWFLTGPRRVGKTTVMLQLIDGLLEEGVHPRRILYATFDHPKLRLAGFEATLSAWEELLPSGEEAEYLFLDELQFIRDWGTYVKMQVDFERPRKVMFTGSAIPLSYRNIESGVGRWHEERIGTMSFFEYLSLTSRMAGMKPLLGSMEELFSWDRDRFAEAASMASVYQPAFNDYVLRGGYPAMALEDDFERIQDYIRNNVIDRTLSKDIVDKLGIRNLVDMEYAMEYYCANDGGILKYKSIEDGLDVSPPTAKRIVDGLVSSQLLEKLRGFTQGKKSMSARPKAYVTDHSIPPAILEEDPGWTGQPERLGFVMENVVFNHLSAHARLTPKRLAYWKSGSQGAEVDFVLTSQSAHVPVEVKYRSSVDLKRHVRGLHRFHEKKGFTRGYLVTRNVKDFGPVERPAVSPGRRKGRVMRVPALLFCYWLGEMVSERRRTAGL